jgi:hypothetical protein
MVVQTICLLAFGVVLSLGGAPYLQACVPLTYQYARLMLKTGNSAIVKEFVTLDMKLVLRYFQSDAVNVAKSASDAAFEILQEAVRRKIRRKCGSKKIVPTIAECMIKGMEEINKSEGSDQKRLTTILESATKLFSSKIDENQIQQAEDFVRGWMVLLMTAIDPPKRGGRRSPILNSLLDTWVAALQREAEADSETIKMVLDEVAQDIREWCEKDQLSCSNGVKAWMYLLHASARRDIRGEASILISTVIAQSLQMAVGNGHREVIKQALVDCAASLNQNIKRNDVQNMTAFSQATNLLYTTAKSKARDVATLLEETFGSNINGTMGPGGEVSPPSLIDSRPVAPGSIPELLGSSENNVQGDPINELQASPARDAQVSPAPENQPNLTHELPSDAVHELPSGVIRDLPSNVIHELPVMVH